MSRVVIAIIVGVGVRNVTGEGGERR